MTDSLKLAVIIPCYNHERYVGNAIESALNQTRKPDRVIVIDDGSKDGSVDVIRGYEKDGVECAARENRGAHNTINELVERASADCDVVSILNSDDHYLPERFQKCLPVLEGRPEISVVCSELKIIDEDDAVLSLDHPRAKWFRAVWSMEQVEDLDYCEWLGVANFPATTSNVIARADFLRRYPFRPYRFNHDYYFLAQSVLRGALELVREPLVNYRVHGSNTINSAPAPLLKEMLRMNLDVYHDIAGELKEDAELRRRFYTYTRALWDSISALHGGVMQVLLADAASRLGEEEIEQLVTGLDEEGSFSELNSYPNKAFVNEHDGTSPVIEGEGLAEKYEALRRERAELKAELKAARELAKLRNNLLKSRGVAWKRVFGAGGDLVSDAGKGSAEKLRNLRRVLGLEDGQD